MKAQLELFPETKSKSSVVDIPILTIKQPWAWLIVSGYKDIENRDWQTGIRGRFLVHAAKTMNPDDYAIAAGILEQTHPGARLPSEGELLKGGVIGEATIVDCVCDSTSPWFFGRYGFVLERQRMLEYIPMRGQLGFFKK